MTSFIFNKLDRAEATKNKLIKILDVINYYNHSNNLKFYKEDLEQIKALILDISAINGLDIQ